MQRMTKHNLGEGTRFLTKIKEVDKNYCRFSALALAEYL